MNGYTKIQRRTKLNTNLISIKDFASYLHKPVSTIYSWKDKGDLPKELFLQIGGSWFVKINRFNEWAA